MEPRVVLTIPSDPKYLSLTREVTSKMALIAGLAEDESEQVKLAVDEACTNVIRHGYRGDTGEQITLAFVAAPTAFEVVIDDNAPKVDCSALRGRDLDEVRPGGLGIHFIKRVFDVFEFDENKKKGNRLKLVRYTRQ